mmetsp:Transcript_16126/g.52479  ORF Transcript_16126/g.52479 Transcript_16126/m.52479 type:complete len:325 (+) Transcript_16126:46-1020(+)
MCVYKAAPLLFSPGGGGPAVVCGRRKNGGSSSFGVEAVEVAAVVDEGGPVGVGPEGRSVSDDEEGVPRSGEGDVEPAEVGEEADGLFLVGPDGGDDDDVLFASLEGVDGVDFDSSFVVRLQSVGDGSGLGAIGRDDADGLGRDVGEEPRDEPRDDADLLFVPVTRALGGAVVSSGDVVSAAGASVLASVAAFWDVDEGDGVCLGVLTKGQEARGRVRSSPFVGDEGAGDDAAVVEARRGEGADRGVHAVLLGQEARLDAGVDEALEEGPAEAFGLRRRREDRRRQLHLVADHDELAGPEGRRHWHEARRLRRLRRLVHDDQTEV